MVCVLIRLTIITACLWVSVRPILQLSLPPRALASPLARSRPSTSQPSAISRTLTMPPRGPKARLALNGRPRQAARPKGGPSAGASVGSVLLVQNLPLDVKPEDVSGAPSHRLPLPQASQTDPLDA